MKNYQHPLGARTRHPGRIVVRVEKSAEGFTAYAEKHPVTANGSTLTELLDECVQALNYCFEDPAQRIDRSHLELRMDLRDFFRHYPVLNAKYLARRIGMHPTLLSHYIQGRKRPGPDQLERIVHGIRVIGEELVGVGF